MKKITWLLWITIVIFLSAFTEPKYDMYDECEDGCFFAAKTCYSACYPDEKDFVYCLFDCARDWFDCTESC